MKRIICTAALVLSVGSLEAAPRIFTSTDGKTIQAEVIAADGLQATLKLADGRQTAVPLNRLSQADQQYLADWVKANPQAIRYSFTVDATKDKLESKTAATGSSIVKGTATSWLYHVKITNRASQAITGLKMRYQIHYTDVEGTTKSSEFKSGVKDVPDLKPGGSTTVDTDPVELVKTELNGSFYYADGAKSRQSDTIKGIAVRLEHNGKPVYDFGTANVKMVAESEASTRAGSAPR
jgi:hypothetical protein